MSNNTQGTLLKMKISGTFTTVAKRTKITPNESTAAKLVSTDLDSEAHESIGGLTDEGVLTLEGNLKTDDPTHAALWTAKRDRQPREWQLVLSDTGQTLYEFDGWISSFQLGEMVTDTIQKFTTKIQITGLVEQTV